MIPHSHQTSHLQPPSSLWPQNPLRVPDDEAAIPRLETWLFHSTILPHPDHREVLVYLPEVYFSDPARRFPVFYLQDGQNLFDPRTAYVPGHTWQAHTTADRLTAAGEIEPVILVGIANTGLHRLAEYTPTRDTKLGGGEGSVYGNLLIHEIKPFIDGHYRTRPAATDTALGGSSLGGLISLYLGFEHPEVFRRLAVLSPSVWWDHRSILDLVSRTHPRPPLRIWLDMGTAEGPRHLRNTSHLHHLLLQLGWQEGVDLAYMEVEGATHTEDAWAARFDHVLKFLFPAK
ncbi:MAG TPA: alpha/beta hydrolase-fold protein [Granulicella sp.]